MRKRTKSISQFENLSLNLTTLIRVCVCVPESSSFLFCCFAWHESTLCLEHWVAWLLCACLISLPFVFHLLQQHTSCHSYVGLLYKVVRSVVEGGRSSSTDSDHTILDRRRRSKLASRREEQQQRNVCFKYHSGAFVEFSNGLFWYQGISRLMPVQCC